MVKFLYVTMLCFIILWASCQTRKYNGKTNSIHSCNNSMSMVSTYRSFDEFSMKGIGETDDVPYLTVKRICDTLVVSSFGTNDSVRTYIYNHEGYWYSYMEYEMWKKNGYVLLKEPWERMARSYDRFFYKNTIYEYEQACLEDYKFCRLHVKTKDSYICVFLNQQLNRENRNQLFHKCLEIANDKNLKRDFYSIHDEGNYIVYRREGMGKDSIAFEQSVFGIWGIQPGIDEQRIVRGQNINNYSHQFPNGRNENVYQDKIYDSADIMPQFHAGVAELQRYLDSSAKDNNFNENDRVTLSFVVDVDGSIYDVKVIKSTNHKLDTRAVQIVSNMSKWLPGTINGQKAKVRCYVTVMRNDSNHSS